MESLKPLREVAACLSLTVKVIQTTENQLTGQEESVANKIETSFEEFHTLIERCKQQLLEEARKKVNDQKVNLQGQKKNMAISGAEVQIIVDYTEQYVKHCPDDEVMCMHAENGSRIKRNIDHHMSWRSLAHVEDVDIGVEVSCAEALTVLLNSN